MANKDHVFVLEALKELPFNVGRKLLSDFLRGEINNPSIVKNKLDELDSFGSLAYSQGEINSLIGTLLIKGLIKQVPLEHNKNWKVLDITQKGLLELKNPKLNLSSNPFENQKVEKKKTVITQKEEQLFENFDFFLKKYNKEQKKAIVNNKEKILCIAGAGSGKTTVLTKRIEFLVRFKGADPNKILAITFTRKARREMKERLARNLKGVEVNVETFNSFCEKQLQKNNDYLYDQNFKMINYGDKIRMVTKALERQGITMQIAIDNYFNKGQKNGKTPEQLANIFISDCFFVRDYCKFKNKSIEDESFEDISDKDIRSANLVKEISIFIDKYMHKKGLRDYADQLIDCINLFKFHKNLIPEFDHVLIDEYQDVNSSQIELINLLNPENLFCVGDPRQSIFGWRGSDINYIINFEDKYPNAEIIHLTKNYRSNKHIVNLSNESIRHMALPDLEPVIEGEKDIKVVSFESEQAEREFICQAIPTLNISRKEIFVLARTNKQLNELSTVLRERNISHVVRSDEIKRNVVAGENDVTLATVHAIKGLEAKTVFVIGCTTSSFPCRGSEHPVIEMIKVDEYDKEEEEKRLFYVALSRAKDSLYISYSGKKPTNFLTPSLLSVIDKNLAKETQTTLVKTPGYKKAGGDGAEERLRQWRYELSKELGIPPYRVMHDKTIIDLATKKPMTLSDLENIYGLGPSKIRKYGEEILSIIG
jgi:superfamily I DNA/RNA helicase